MASRNDQGEGREFSNRILQKDGCNVSLQVVDSHEGYAQRKGQTFGVRESHQEGPNQAGTLRDSDCIQGLEGQARPGQGLGHHLTDIVNVFAAGQFRHHTAKVMVSRDLRGHNTGEKPVAVLQDGGSSLIAA